MRMFEAFPDRDEAIPTPLPFGSIPRIEAGQSVKCTARAMISEPATKNWKQVLRLHYKRAKLQFENPAAEEVFLIGFSWKAADGTRYRTNAVYCRGQVRNVEILRSSFLQKMLRRVLLGF